MASCATERDVWSEQSQAGKDANMLATVLLLLGHAAAWRDVTDCAFSHVMHYGHLDALGCVNPALCACREN